MSSEYDSKSKFSQLSIESQNRYLRYKVEILEAQIQSWRDKPLAFVNLEALNVHLRRVEEEVTSKIASRILEDTVGGGNRPLG